MDFLLNPVWLLELLNLSETEWHVLLQMVLAGLGGALLGWTLWYLKEEMRTYASHLPQKVKEGRRVRMTILGVRLLIGAVIGVATAVAVWTGWIDRGYATAEAFVFSAFIGRLSAFKLPGTAT